MVKHGTAYSLKIITKSHEKLDQSGFFTVLFIESSMYCPFWFHEGGLVGPKLPTFGGENKKQIDPVAA